MVNFKTIGDQKKEIFIHNATTQMITIEFLV